MSRRTYSNVLKRVLKHNGELELRNVDLARLAPYIRPQVLRSSLAQGKTVALPSLWVKGAYWGAKLTPEQRLWVGACRTAGSYQGEGAHNRVPTPGSPEYLWEALAYAERNWPSLLKSDLSLSAALFTLCDPFTLGLPMSARASCSVVFSVDILQTHQAKDADVLNKHILNIAQGSTRLEEWLGDSSTEFLHCLRCGHALLPTFCSGCKTTYPRPQRFPDHGISMPPRIKSAWHSAGVRFNPPRRVVT